MADFEINIPASAVKELKKAMDMGFGVDISVSIGGTVTVSGGGVPELAFIDARDDTPAGLGSAAVMTYDINLPAGDLLFFVANMSAGEGLTVDGAPATLVDSDLESNRNIYVYHYRNPSAGEKTIAVSDGGSTLLDQFCGVYSVLNYNGLTVDKALPTDAGGPIVAISITTNSATFIPTAASGILTERFNADIRSNENVYLGDAPAGTTLSGSPTAGQSVVVAILNSA